MPLTHAERRDRRRMIADAVRADDKGMIDIAIEFGVTIATVNAACDEHGISHKDRLRKTYRPNDSAAIVPRSAWEKLDWAKQDMVLSKELGVSRERVRQVRIALKKGRPANYHRQQNGLLVLKWMVESRAEIDGLRIVDIRRICPLKTSYETIVKCAGEANITVAKFVPLRISVTKENIENITEKTPGPLESPCWKWLLSKRGNGYGLLAGMSKGYAHRAVYEIFNGPIPDGLWCLHKCDNPWCVNPSHLYAGTATDNARDREARGRRKAYHKLADEEVCQVKAMYLAGNSTIYKISRRFGVSWGTIRSIVTGDAKYAQTSTELAKAS